MLPFLFSNHACTNTTCCQQQACPGGPSAAEGQPLSGALSLRSVPGKACRPGNKLLGTAANTKHAAEAALWLTSGASQAGTA